MMQELWRIRKDFEVAIDYETILPLAPINFQLQIFTSPDITLSKISASIHLVLIKSGLDKNFTKFVPSHHNPSNTTSHTVYGDHISGGLPKDAAKLEEYAGKYRSDGYKMIDYNLQNTNNNLIFTLECYNLLDILQTNNIQIQLLRVRTQ